LSLACSFASKYYTSRSYYHTKSELQFSEKRKYTLKELNFTRSNIQSRPETKFHQVFTLKLFTSYLNHKVALPAMSNPTGLVHGWVSAVCGRGTIDILWSCLVTTILCVWTAIHLPVPHYELDWPLSMRKEIVRSKIVPALIFIIAPEMLTYTAIVEFLSAWKTTEALKSLLPNENISLVHGFFLEMGGFCFKFEGDKYRQIEVDDIADLLGISPQLIERKERVESRLTRRKNTHDNMESIARDTQMQWAEELGKVSKDQINETANSDALTKLITVGQVSWFGTQVVSRLVQHRAVTLLEVSTSAYVFYALAAYLAWCKKPQGSQIPLIISSTEKTAAPERMTSYSRVQGTWREFLWGGIDWFEPVDKDIPPWHIALLTLLPTAYGAFYVASWNITLPSKVELWLWRGSGLYCMAFGLSVGLLFAIDRPLDKSPKAALKLSRYLTVGTIALYTMVRLCMGVEVLISLRALPHSAYDSIQWSTFVPHI